VLGGGVFKLVIISHTGSLSLSYPEYSSQVANLNAN
jgi:hypothetical protein